jgi:hypothetical protein
LVKQEKVMISFLWREYDSCWVFQTSDHKSLVSSSINHHPSNSSSCPCSSHSFSHLEKVDSPLQEKFGQVMTWDVSKMWVSKSFPQKMRKKTCSNHLLLCFQINLAISFLFQCFNWSISSSFSLIQLSPPKTRKHLRIHVLFIHSFPCQWPCESSWWWWWSQRTCSFFTISLVFLKVLSKSILQLNLFSGSQNHRPFENTKFVLFMSSNCSEFWSLLSLNWLLDSSFCRDHVHFAHIFKWNHNWFTFSFENKKGCLSRNLRSHEECSPQFWKWIFFIIKWFWLMISFLLNHRAVNPSS